LRLSVAAHRRLLVAAFLVFWLALAMAPAKRADWIAENLFVLALAVVLWLTRRELLLSRLSATAVFAFLCLHEIGAHYTYAAVPYETWLATLTGTTLQDLLGLERNHFDRLVHLMFGLLLTYPMREALLGLTPVRGRWSWLLPVALSMAAAMAYELAEWLVAALFGGDLATAYLGMQGDIWDAQKDMALSTAGAILAMILARRLLAREGPAGEDRRRADPPRAAASLRP
jgi:putative membrane protein